MAAASTPPTGKVWVDETAQALARGERTVTFGLNMQILSPLASSNAAEFVVSN
jgi:hypothetical protein